MTPAARAPAALGRTWTKSKKQLALLFFRNFARGSPTAILPVTMVDEFESSARLLPPAQEKAAKRPASAERLTDRPFRVKLRGSVLVLVRLPNKRALRASFHQLSTTGGVIHFEKPLDEKLEVELIFHIRETTIRSKAQMLFPMWATQGWMQPFRFLDLPEANRVVLDEVLKTFIGEAAKGATAAS